MACSSSSFHFLKLTPQTLPKPTSQTASISFFSLPPSSLNLSLSTSRNLSDSCFLPKVTLSDFDQIEEEVDNNEGLSDDAPIYGREERNDNPDLKIFVGNLPFSVDSAALAGIFEQAGDVEMVEVIYDKLTGRSRGFGFVTMSSKEEVEAACQQFNGYEIEGRALRVNSGPPPPKREGSFRDNSSFGGGSRGGGSMDSSNRVYVGNLAWGVDQEALETLFSEQGKVVDAKVVYDRDSGRSRGFGFVTYSSAEEVNSAIESLDGVDLNGRAIRVSPAEARPPRRQF
ncbi:29 kDa ribonucleoprotein A, chloroplastic-like [Lycium barbarum]|uniref:29 kDa ribonucleoprotein A, chloroplastic-like n=1 Tax=Lycium barbarum TaxID=112863 RepID=UPI00293F6AE2|nr:29 kDa ribonucleoprotein A, chloroplastic-like [Lycium barbarum]